MFAVFDSLPQKSGVRKARSGRLILLETKYCSRPADISPRRRHRTRTPPVAGALRGGLNVLALNANVRADEIPAEYRPTVQKGLEYLAKTQHKDGHWEAFGGQYPITMTGVSGMALL